MDQFHWPRDDPAGDQATAGEDPAPDADRAGRDREDPRRARLGAGGRGKPRLSLQTGADLMDQFEGGVWFIELAALTEESQVIPAVAAALGLKETAGQSLLHLLTGYLQSRSLLLILDN